MAPFTITLTATAVIEIVAVVIVGLLAARQFRERQVRIASMWLLPAFMFLISYTSIQNDLFDNDLSAPIIGLGFVVGLILGGMRGALTRVRIDREHGCLYVKGTPISVVLWVALLGVKALGDVALVATNTSHQNTGVIAASVITASLVALSLAATIATRIYFYWRFTLAADA